MKQCLEKVNKYINVVRELPHQQNNFGERFSTECWVFFRSILELSFIIPVFVNQDAECPEDICCG